MYPGSLVDVHCKNKTGKDIVVIRRGIFLYRIDGDIPNKYSVIRYSKKLGFEPVIVCGHLTYSKPKVGDVVIDIERPAQKWSCLGKAGREARYSVAPVDDSRPEGLRVSTTMEEYQIVALLSTGSHEIFDSKTKIAVGKDKRMGWLRGVDEEGLVVEFDSPVGQHSYDGLFKARHCSIVSPKQIFENIQEVSYEDKSDSPEDS